MIARTMFYNHVISKIKHQLQYKPGGFLFPHLTQWRGLRVGSRDFCSFFHSYGWVTDNCLKINYPPTTADHKYTDRSVSAVILIIIHTCVNNSDCRWASIQPPSTVDLLITIEIGSLLLKYLYISYCLRASA